MNAKGDSMPAESTTSDETLSYDDGALDPFIED